MHPQVKLTVLLVGLILTGLPASTVDHEKKVKKTILSVYNRPHTIHYTKFPIPAKMKEDIEDRLKQKFITRELNVWLVKHNKTVIGYAIVDHAYSKTRLFTFLVIFNKGGAILLARVLKYREEHGGEIKNKRWLKQFNGKDHRASFMLGDNIDAISGATLSARTITTAIQKLTLLIDHVIKEEG